VQAYVSHVPDEDRAPGGDEVDGVVQDGAQVRHVGEALGHRVQQHAVGPRPRSADGRKRRADPRRTGLVRGGLDEDGAGAGTAPQLPHRGGGDIGTDVPAHVISYPVHEQPGAAAEFQDPAGPRAQHELDGVLDPFPHVVDRHGTAGVGGPPAGQIQIVRVAHLRLGVRPVIDLPPMVEVLLDQPAERGRCGERGRGRPDPDGAVRVDPGVVDPRMLRQHLGRLSEQGGRPIGRRPIGGPP
jgi:hypothetical protein